MRWRNLRWALCLALLAMSGLSSCDEGSVSVGVGLAVPAPWGAVTVMPVTPIGYPAQYPYPYY
jgi:hypothetical protein